MNSLYENNSYVLEEFRVIYIPIAKNACTTLKRFVCRLSGLKEPEPLMAGKESKLHMSIHDRSQLKIPSIFDLKETYPNILFNPDFFAFAVKRNPYDRLYSAWKNKILFEEPSYLTFIKKIKKQCGISYEDYIPFDIFVKYLFEHENLNHCDQHWQKQTSILNANVMNAVKIYDLSEINKLFSDLSMHCSDKSIKDFKISANKTVNFLGKSSYDEKTADMVFKMYNDDFQILGYKENTWTRQSEESCNKDELFKYFLKEIHQRNKTISALYDKLYQTD